MTRTSTSARAAADLDVTLTQDAATAIANGLPGVTAATLVDVAAVPSLDAVVTASFVGERSADLALAITDAELLGAMAGTAVVGAADVLRPALEGVADVLGAGVLGEVQDAASSGLFTSATVFELSGAAGTIGWVAVKVKAKAAGSSAATAPLNLGRISGVEMELTVEIGRTRMAVRDVLGLTPGAIVELDHAVGSPADILLNGRLIAHGDIVVVDDDYAIRVTRIIETA